MCEPLSARTPRPPAATPKYAPLAVGQSNNATFLRPISEGHVNAAANVRHRGRTSWVWQVEITDDEGRLCALAQVVVALRAAR